MILAWFPSPKASPSLLLLKPSCQKAEPVAYLAYLACGLDFFFLNTLLYDKVIFSDNKEINNKNGQERFADNKMFLLLNFAHTIMPVNTHSVVVLVVGGRGQRQR